MALLLAVTACGSAATSGNSPQGSPAPSPAPTKATAAHHIVLVMEENRSYPDVVGNTSNWPNFNNLLKEGAAPTNYYANKHYSIGNYFMLTTGQILTTDDHSTKVWDVDNIARRMLAAGVSFKIYAEGITRGYVGGNKGDYVINHDPFAMLSDIADNSKVANQVMWPFSQFATDLANNQLPEFSYVLPSNKDNSHSAAPGRADSWLQTNVVEPLSRYSAFQPGGDGVLIVDWDEGRNSDIAHGGGHVAPVLWGPGAKSSYKQQSSTIYQHESMLRSIMEELGLSTPPGDAATAPSMSEFFVK